MKCRYLFILLSAAITRALTILFLLADPSGIFLYLVYSLPNLIWLTSYFILMAFLAVLYLQLRKSFCK